MPVMQPFTFTGTRTPGWIAPMVVGEMFSGFPLSAKVDVSGFDKWVTLGGTQKGSIPTPAEIALSHQRAAQLFWRLYAFRAGYSIAFDDWSWSNNDEGVVHRRSRTLHSDDGVAEPKDRGLLSSWSFQAYAFDGPVNPVPNDRVVIHYEVHPPTRMFDGADFIGWGFAPQTVAGHRNAWGAFDGDYIYCNPACCLGNWSIDRDQQFPEDPEYPQIWLSSYRTISGFPQVQTIGDDRPEWSDSLLRRFFDSRVGFEPTFDFWELPPQ